MGKEVGNDAWSTLKRLHRLVALLAEHGESGVSFEDIRTEIYPEDVSSASLRRKFNRDRKNLRKLFGEVLEEEEIDERDHEETVTIKKNSEGRYVMKSRFNFMMPMKLDEKQLLALVAGVRLTQHFVNVLRNPSEEVWGKLKRQIPANFLDKSDRLSEAITANIPISRIKGDDEIFQKVLDAIEGKKVLKVGQYTNGEGKTRTCTLSPYVLYLKHHAWYVMGLSHDAPIKLLPFRLGRMRLVEHLNDVDFIPIAESMKDLRRRIALDFYPADTELSYFVRLRITGSFARPCMETEWFPGEKKSWEEGGKSVLYEVELMGLEAITLWIMRALDCVEVLEPKKLADEIDRRVGAYLERRNKRRTR